LIEEYTTALFCGDTFPPIVVFYDGADYWLADGFHRLEAHRRHGLEEIDADIRQGTRRDAVLYACGANASHGLRRTNADKRRAVETLLNDQEWSQWSDREIARRCGVGNRFVSDMRQEHTVFGTQYEKRIFIHPKTGQPTTMQTANIGRASQDEPPPMFAAEPELHFDPEAQVAYCKYCYETHGDWLFEEGEAWECQRCGHRTRDEYLPVAQEPEPEEVDYGANAQEAAEYDSNEWYTPLAFIEAARAVMGYIHLDPASCELAQETVKAGEYFNKERDGLAQEWNGNIWLNPPYGDPLPWVEKLVTEHQVGRVRQAILLVNTANSPQWSRLLWHSSFAVCLLDRRVRFWRPDRMEAKGTAQDQMLWYIGENVAQFREVFADFGAIR
jgi:hypothetical protein